MALKLKVKSKDEVPAELVNLYVERDGAWLLDVDGAVEKARLEGFRATNVALMKERDELRPRFEDIDPEKARKLAYEELSALSSAAGQFRRGMRGGVWRLAVAQQFPA